MNNSGKKLAKKARSIFRKNQQAFWSSAMKPKPKWIPWSVWLFLLGKFIKIDQ